MIKRKFAAINLGILMIATLGLFMPINQASAHPGDFQLPMSGPAGGLECGDGLFINIPINTAAQQFGNFPSFDLNGGEVTGIEFQMEARRNGGSN